jgi:nitroreductase
MFSETFAAAWALRYGEPPGFESPPIDRFLTHRSVRKYSGQPIAEEIIAGLIAAAQSSATSSNLQLWTAISIQDPERREKIAMLCGDQNQIREAAWFFAFVADHYRLKSAAAAVGEAAQGLDYTEFFAMALVDVALAAERLVCAAESLGIGICYIGALRNDPAGIRELLDLPESTFGVFGLCLGWPAEEARAEIKPRLPQAAVWHRERYQIDVDVDDYDRRMAGFYEGQKMKGDVTWSMRSGRRVDGQHMTGREVLHAWLEGQGFNLR